VICRWAFRLEHIVTLRHFDYMAKIMLVTGTIVGYAYATEFFTAWYSGNPYEVYVFLNRALGPYAWAYWIMISCNVISPQVFWFKKARTSIPILFTLSIIINIGMWFERFVIIVTSLHRDFLPSSWGYFSPTIWDISCLLGSFGLFFTMFCLFVRFLPMVATAEVKGVLPQAHVHGHSDPERAVTHHDIVAAPVVAEAPAGWSFDIPLIPRLPKGPYYGVLAEFPTPQALYSACERVRDAGFTRWDSHSPFPVHGLHKAMGLKRSTLPWIVLVMALTGGALGFILQWWVHTSAYPLVISGKPFFTWPAFIPITFEVSVLFGALGAVFGMLGLNRLPMHHHPLFKSKVFERASDDTFFISIESWDPRFDPKNTATMLKSLGARSVELLES
jgi:Alternative complex III, ActD subunit